MRGDGVRILIVGAGIAGLAAARTLRRWDGAVEIVERAPAPTTEGTGIYCDGPPGQPLPLRDLLAGYAEPVPIPLDGLDEARLVDGCVLITGEVDRTTEYERGMPPAHQARTGSAWQPDPLILDDQALVVHVRRRGLVVLTGCGHAGAINIVRDAQRLTGVPTPARTARWPAPGRSRIRTHHQSRRPRAHRDGAEPRPSRPLHRLARPARARGGPPRQLGRRQQRLVLLPRRGLTSCGRLGRAGPTAPGTDLGTLSASRFSSGQTSPKTGMTS
jgi:hypothetical protein